MPLLDYGAGRGLGTSWGGPMLVRTFVHLHVHLGVCTYVHLQQHSMHAARARCQASAQTLGVCFC